MLDLSLWDIRLDVRRISRSTFGVAVRGVDTGVQGSSHGSPPFSTLDMGQRVLGGGIVVERVGIPLAPVIVRGTTPNPQPESRSQRRRQRLFNAHSKTAPKQGVVCTHSKSRQNPPSLTACYQ